MKLIVREVEEEPELFVSVTVSVNYEPLPANVVAVAVPDTSRAVLGEEVPTPNLAFAVSQ